MYSTFSVVVLVVAMGVSASAEAQLDIGNEKYEKIPD